MFGHPSFLARMKKITLSVLVPESLYEQFERLPSHRSAELDQALFECVRRICDMPADERRKGSDRRLPQSDNPGWGQAWSRRWDDQKGEAFMEAEKAALPRRAPSAE